MNTKLISSRSMCRLLLMLIMVGACGCFALIPPILCRPFTIKGRVTDQYGDPVSKAGIEVQWKPSSLSGFPPVWNKRMLTNTNGYYRVTVRNVESASVYLKSKSIPTGYRFKEGEKYHASIVYFHSQIRTNVNFTIHKIEPKAGNQ